MATAFTTSGSWRTWAAQLLALAVLVGIIVFFWRSGTAVSYNWQWFRIPRLLFPGWRNDVWQWGPLVDGLRITFVLALLGAPFAAAIGLAAALMGKSQLITLRWVARIYVEVVRNTPMLVQLYLLYFLLASIFSLDRFTAGVLALAIFEGAFAAEIFRAGLDATPRGQLDAARSLGLTRWQSFRFIALPQSLPLTLPPLASLFVALVKHSSLLSVVAIPELTNLARNVIADTYLTFEVWLVIAAIYIVLCYFLSQAIGMWERRLLARQSLGVPLR